ncbi:MULTISPECIES: ABC transporter ATP-binding protein [unclassified Fusibacter]|uniref:ABC transporter ATP-binding protein n=1 Tax=unclassified Fusibacter TaxID=2624464 RepID=UPI001010926D|nr:MULTISPECIES: ABC transporter ATP-binding protein [unclassified Fusibacter]MCK8059396.1 ABC transporter ATP-binding protein [Fusibacter sp. A2]NPE21140.1 ABC transporter ATP-binding protein [Fusibacter sp. A1]RXV62409.1 ABC transporter ATP-binding protein [Fusibacter sp. A1]
MILVKGLKKSFVLSKKQRAANKEDSPIKHALKGIDFEVKKNEIFGLLGPNGAGKTTTLRCLSTLIVPTEGDVYINGFHGVREGEKVRESLAFLTSELKLDPHFTPEYTVKFFGRLHGMDVQLLKDRMEHLFESFGVSDFRHTKIKDLSTGMKQKLSIVVSLIHDPKVVIFDEPTNGLDVITAKAVTDYLVELKKSGKTIILSTHMMHVAEKLCDRIAILLDGSIRVVGTADQIKAQTRTNSLEDAFFSYYYEETQVTGDV